MTDKYREAAALLGCNLDTMVGAPAPTLAHVEMRCRTAKKIEAIAALIEGGWVHKEDALAMTTSLLSENDDLDLLSGPLSLFVLSREEP